MLDRAQPSLEEHKKDLRGAAKRRRAEIADNLPNGAAGAAEAVCARVLDTIALPRRCAVSAYWPMGSELDPRPLIRRLSECGHPIGLPVVVAKGRPLVFRAWRPGEVLEPAGFGTQVPCPRRPEIRPRVLLVPMLAFDRAGYRLGYGGGFYDRTLAGLRAGGDALAVGLAYAAQEVDALPHDGNDERLDWIVTEAGAIKIG